MTTKRTTFPKIPTPAENRRERVEDLCRLADRIKGTRKVTIAPSGYTYESTVYRSVD